MMPILRMRIVCVMYSMLVCAYLLANSHHSATVDDQDTLGRHQQQLLVCNALQSVVDMVRYFTWKQTALLVWAPQSLQQDAARIYLKAAIPDMMDIICGSDAIDAMSLHTQTCNFIVLEADKAPDKLFEKAAFQGLFEIKCSWILFSGTLPTSQMNAIAGPFRAQVTLIQLLRPITPLMAVNPSLSTSDASISDVFRSTAALRQVEFAVWTCRSGVQLHERWAAKDLKALGERTVTFTSFHHTPSVVVHFGRPYSGGSVVGGYVKELFDIVFKQGVFRPEYAISYMNIGFGLLVNGTQTGVVGRLGRREVDVAMTLLAILKTRAEVIRYTNHGIYHYYMGICLAKPNRPLSSKSYVLPLSPIVWMAASAMTAIAIVLLIVVALCTPKINSSARHDSGFSLLYWILSGSLLIQVWNETPGLASKVILGAVHAFIVITFIYYTSLFTSVLSYVGSELPVNTLDEVLANNDYRVIALPLTSFYNHFRDAKGGIMKDIWKKKLSKEKIAELPTSIGEALRMVKLGHRVFMHDVVGASSLAHTDCDVVFAAARYLAVDSHVGARPDFPYIRMLSFQFLMINERGLANRNMRRYFPTRRDACVLVSQEVPDPLAVGQVWGLFVVLAAGICLSFVALAVEIFIWRSSSLNVHS